MSKKTGKREPPVKKTKGNLKELLQWIAIILSIIANLIRIHNEL